MVVPSKRSHSLGAVLAALCVLSLVGCATNSRVVTEVSRFNRLSDATAGQLAHAVEPTQNTENQREDANREPQTFTVVPVDRNLTTSLEFQTYAQRIAGALSPHGFKMLPDSEATADLVVLGSYSIDSGREEIRSTPGSAFISGYRHFNPASGVFVSPPIAVIPPRTYSVTRYTRELHIEIVDGPDLAFGRTSPVFEARAVSIGATPSIAYAMPHMIRAGFDGFPGTNGETYVVEAEVDEKSRRPVETTIVPKS